MSVRIIADATRRYRGCGCKARHHRIAETTMAPAGAIAVCRSGVRRLQVAVQPSAAMATIIAAFVALAALPAAVLARCTRLREAALCRLAAIRRLAVAA